MLKKYKYRWDRNVLERCYLSFIRPIIEYGCVLYDSCNQSDCEVLEDIQLEAARLVTGTKRRTSHGSLYEELGWPLLNERRKVYKLTKMYTMANHLSPPYLSRITDSYRGHNTMGTRLTCQGGFHLPKCNTETHRKSPVVSAVKMWNELDANTRTITTLAAFRHKLNSSTLRKPLLLPQSINRMQQIWLMQMRAGFSNLNGHLFERRCVESAACLCGHSVEDTHHFLMECPRYKTLRDTLLQSVNSVCNIQITPKLLLYGSQTLSDFFNHQILKDLATFILEASRFTTG